MVRTSDFCAAVLFARLARRFDLAAVVRGLELRQVPSSARIRSDPALLAQMLDHLVANAVAHTRHGRILVGCRRRRNRLHFEIWDTGSGFGEMARRCLMAEWQADRGLGLAVVDRLARLLDHPVRAERRVGGTRFVVSVPLAPDDPALLKAAPGETRHMVVVIDDEDQILEGMRLLLEAWHFDVVAARSGEQAIALLQDNGRCPAGIIADYYLREGRTGTEAVRHIRGLYNAPIPSIIITGDATAGRLQQSRARGMVVLQKPVAASHLHHVLAQTLKNGE